MPSDKNLQVILNPDHVDLEPVIGLDLETSGLYAWVDRIRLLIISTSKNIYIFDVEKYSEQFLKELFQNILYCQVVVAHNAKFDCGFIYTHYGVLLRNWWCTQINSQIVTNGKKEFKGRHSLPEVIERFLKEKVAFADKAKKLLQKSFTSSFSLGSFTEKQLRYAAEDVKYLIPLYLKQQKTVDALELKAISKLENDLLPILAKMEVEGCLIDAVGWRKLIKDYWEPDLARLEQELDKEVIHLTGKPFTRRKAVATAFDLFGEAKITQLSSEQCINYGSSDQVIQLFRDLGQEVPVVEIKDKKDNENGEHGFDDGIDYRYSLFDEPSQALPEIQGGAVLEGETKDSLEEIALNTYINERPNSIMKPFIRLLLDYRVAAKKISTYGDKFLAKLDSHSKIHTGYTQTFTETGRLSSKAPNLQNIPAPQKGKPETDIRRFFIARPGYRLITCDMSSAEVAIAADYSQEPILLESLRSGLDMHSLLSSVSYSIIFGQDTEISKSETPVLIKGQELIPVTLRDLHKSVVFAKFYKAGAKRIYSVLAEYINLFHPEEKRLEIASQISAALDKKMPRLSKYLDERITLAHKQGYLRGSKLGRIRFFTEDSYGECANMEIQNTNAEALKMAMIQIFNWLLETKLDARIVMNIHDEVVIEAREDIAEEVGKKVCEIVSGCLGYFLKTIKGNATYKISTHWHK